MTLPKPKGGFDLGKKLFLKEEFSDVQMFIKKGNSICRYPCHKAILSATSGVFFKKFNSKFNEGETDEIIEDDINPDIMLNILTYIYSGQVDLDNWKSATEILRAASKYEIVSLIAECEIFLSENLTLRNVCYILDVAILHELVELKEKCLTLCKKGGFIVLKTRAFKELSASAVEEIVRMKYLFVETKMDIFKALWEWATLECCRKQNKLTEKNIFSEFSIVSQYVDFKSLIEAEGYSLPKSVLEYVNKKKRLNLHNGATEVTRRETKAPAEVEPELNFSNISEDLECYLKTKHFSVNTSPTTSLQGYHLSLLRFSVNTDVYLTDFTLMPLNNANTKRYFKSVRLTSKNKIVAEWPQNEDEMLHLHDKGAHSASDKDKTEVHEFLFHVSGFLLLEADVEYTMEVNPEYCQSCPIYWPRVTLNTLNTYSEQDVKFCVHSEYSFAVTSLIFLPAS